MCIYFVYCLFDYSSTIKTLTLTSKRPGILFSLIYSNKVYIDVYLNFVLYVLGIYSIFVE